jgi:putative tricarboxylic transport membrane protein
VAGIVMGLILGKLGESSFSKSMQLLNYEPMALFARPIAAFLLTAAAITLIWNIVNALRGRAADDADGETTTR